LIQDLYFTTPELLWAIPALVIPGAIFIYARAKNKTLAASRLAVFCLLIAAAANPYFVQTHTVQSESPSIIVLDDRTGSMEVFDPDVATRVADFSKAQVRSFQETQLPWETRSYSTPCQAVPWSWSLTATATVAGQFPMLCLLSGRRTRRPLPSPLHP